MQLFLNCSLVLESGTVVLYYCSVVVIININNKFIIKQETLLLHATPEY
jgi:hypothetical protein